MDDTLIQTEAQRLLKAYRMPDGTYYELAFSASAKPCRAYCVLVYRANAENVYAYFSSEADGREGFDAAMKENGHHYGA